MDSLDTSQSQEAYRVYDLILASDCAVSFPLEPVSAKPTLHLKKASTAFFDENAADAPIYETEAQTSEGQPLGSLYQLGDTHIYRIREVADFEVEGRTIRYWPHTEESRAIEYFLLGVILPLWLERAGQPVLHCSAIEVDGEAVVFLAPSHTGKSSLAASFLQRGNRLVTDDVMPLRFEDEKILGIPSFPVLRMWPEQAAHFVGAQHELDLIRRASRKRWVPAEALRGDGFRTEPLPVRATYLLERESDPKDADDIRFETLNKTEAVLELIRHSFLGRPVQFAGLAPRRLELFARFVAEVPVRKLVYPSGFAELPRVCAAIIRNAVTGSV